MWFRARQSKRIKPSPPGSRNMQQGAECKRVSSTCSLGNILWSVSSAGTTAAGRYLQGLQGLTQSTYCFGLHATKTPSSLVGMAIAQQGGNSVFRERRAGVSKQHQVGL